MKKNLSKPHIINARLTAPLGRKGVPPEAAIPGGETYIIVTNDLSVKQAIDNLFDTDSSTLTH